MPKMSGIQVNDACRAGDIFGCLVLYSGGAKQSSHHCMKLAARVSEYRPIAMYTYQMTGTKLISSGYSPQRLHSGIENSLHSSTLSPPQKDHILLIGSVLGHPSFSPLQLRTRLQSIQFMCSPGKARSYLQYLHSSESSQCVEVRIARKFPGNDEGTR
jgi:hypothetical protein